MSLSADAAYGVSHPRTGWSEQDPQDWITACQTAIAALRRDHPTELAALRGIGLSGHMHGATLLDAAGKVLRPCILWNDTRSAAEAAQLDGTKGVRDLSGLSCFPASPHRNWRGSRRMSRRSMRRSPGSASRIIRYWLTGLCL